MSCDAKQLFLTNFEQIEAKVSVLQFAKRVHNTNNNNNIILSQTQSQFHFHPPTAIIIISIHPIPTKSSFLITNKQTNKHHYCIVLYFSLQFIHVRQSDFLPSLSTLIIAATLSFSFIFLVPFPFPIPQKNTHNHQPCPLPLLSLQHQQQHPRIKTRISTMINPNPSTLISYSAPALSSVGNSNKFTKTCLP